MPKMVTIEPNKNVGFSALKDEAKKRELQAQYEIVKKSGPQKNGVITLPYVDAQEATKNSGGLYRIRPEKAPGDAPEMSLEDKTNDELKLMMLGLGAKLTGKVMTRASMITYIQDKLDAVTVE